ncbi:MAG: response regulator [Candidatus Obscuribacterales bacterium]|nr:response regulator [Candidatus Obscuribacterales bacterium]
MEIKKVVMVDDDASIRRITQIVLTKLKSWEVILVESGTKALELIPKEAPDVVLMDVMMPGMDGVTTFTRLKEMGFENLPVIFMTAKVQNQEMDAYREMGAAGVISKPFQPSDLPDQIQSITMQWCTGGDAVCQNC